MLMFFVAAVPTQARQLTPRQELEKAHEGVRFHEVGERVRIAYAVPMTAGETPEEAAEAWLTLYGEIFIDSREAGGLDLRRTRRFETRSGKVIFGYSQWIDGVPVETSSARLMAMELDEQWRVVYASARVGLRPKGGLQEPIITRAQALAAAQEHEAGKALIRWTLPELAAVYEDAPTGSAEAIGIWKCVGSNHLDSRTFYIDVISGGVLTHFSNVLHAHDDTISGTVTGKKSPGTKPDHDDKECENLPAEEPMPGVKVEARDGQTLVASAFTDENGDYVLEYSGTANVTVTASLEFAGEAWRIIDVDGEWFVPCPTSSVTPVYASTNANSPSTGIDLLLNASPSEYATAQTNAAHGLWKTRKYVRDRLPDEMLPVNGLDDVLEVFVNVESGVANARYIANCYGCNNNEPCLVFSPAFEGCANSAYSTFVAHEYGHYLLHQMLGIASNEDIKPFHEGWAHALALLTFDTDKWAEDFCACGTAIHEPLIYDPQYPVCASDPYLRGLLIAALWLDLAADAGLGSIEGKQLHVDWMLLCEWPNQTGCSRQQSAGPSTLIEVLVADDDDGDLYNGTPNREIICEVFANRNIDSFWCNIDSNSRCFADCDRSTGVGVLDVLDYLCFANRFAAGDPYACECDTSTGVGACDIFDFLCFHRSFMEGCS